MKLIIDSQAPDFSAPNEDGKIIKLSDYSGKWVLLYFYPKDFTPGCTTEACELRDNSTELQKYLTVLGVSTDDVESHKKFKEKYELPFTLISDENKVITKSYGADGFLFQKRVSFLIDPSGKIVKIYEKVVPAEHANEILEDIKSLSKS